MRSEEILLLLLGDQNLLVDDGHEQVFNISAIIIHHRYNSVTYDNDVALVRLGKAANLSEFVNTLCLPSIVPWPGMRCVIAGWGATMEHGQASNNLLKVEVPIVDRSTCARADIYGSKLTRNMVCAGYAQGGKDTCQGDSGGPLHCQNKDNPNIWEVQGIASWGRGCGRQLRYGVYTKVHNFVAWIKCIAQSSERTVIMQRENNQSIVCRGNATDVNTTRAYTVQVVTTLNDYGLLHSRANSLISATASEEYRYQISENIPTFSSSSWRSTDKTGEALSESLRLFISKTPATSLNTSYIHHSKSFQGSQSSIHPSISKITKQTEMLPGGENGLASFYATTAEQTKVVESELPHSIAVLSNTEPFTTIMRPATRSITSNTPATEEPKRTNILPRVTWMETTFKSAIITPCVSFSYLERSSMAPNSEKAERNGETGFSAGGSLMPDSTITTNIQIDISKMLWQASALGLPSNATNYTSSMYSTATSSWYANNKTVVPDTKSNGSQICASAALHPIAITFLCIRYIRW